MLCKNVG